MATREEIMAELQELATRVHEGGDPLTARERRRFRKLATRAGLKDSHALIAPAHRPAAENLHRYQGVDAETRQVSLRLASRPSGRRKRL